MIMIQNYVFVNENWKKKHKYNARSMHRETCSFTEFSVLSFSLLTTIGPCHPAINTLSSNDKK